MFIRPTNRPDFWFPMRTILRLTKRGTIKVMGTSRHTRFVLDTIMRPAYRSARYSLLANVELWGESFWIEWEALPVDKKLTWFLFLSHTIALITLIEVFILRRGK